MAKKLNDDGIRYHINNNNVRLTADVLKGDIGWVYLADILDGTITDLGQIKSFDTIKLSGIYKYETATGVEPDRTSKSGFLSVTSNIKTSSGSGTITQRRIEDGEILKRKGTRRYWDDTIVWEEWINMSSYIDVYKRLFFNSNGEQVINWENKQLQIFGGLTVLDWEKHILYDRDFTTSVDWNNRWLHASGTAPIISWNNGLGFWGKSNYPKSKPAAISNATTATDAITKLNDLLAVMRNYGLIAE